MFAGSDEVRSMKEKNIVVMIPTLNETKAIGKTIDDVLKYVPRCQILVLDSYSINSTADVARDKGAVVINACRGGKGIAVRSVLPQIMISYRADYYVMIDGDFTYPAKHLPEIVKRLDNGADVVIGYRAKRKKGAMTHINIIGNRGLSILASILYGVHVKDVCSGMWGFRRSVLSRYKLSSNDFTLEADLFINTVRNGFKLAQIPIEYRARLDGSVAKLGIKDGFKIAWFLIKRRVK